MDQKNKTILDDVSDRGLTETIIKESAKAAKEISTAEADIAKAHRRLRFCIMMANRLKERLD